MPQTTQTQVRVTVLKGVRSEVFLHQHTLGVLHEGCVQGPRDRKPPSWLLAVATVREMRGSGNLSLLGQPGAERACVSVTLTHWDMTPRTSHCLSWHVLRGDWKCWEGKGPTAGPPGSVRYEDDTIPSHGGDAFEDRIFSPCVAEEDPGLLTFLSPHPW